MRKFKIIPIFHSLRNNVMGKEGEEVFESQLTSPADELVSKGILKEVFEKGKGFPKAEESDAGEEEQKTEKPSVKDIKSFKKK